MEAVYKDPGDLLNPTATTDNNGSFSLQVLKNKVTYLRMTKTDFATVNTFKVELNADITGMAISLPTEAEAQIMIDTALGIATTPLVNKAWLTVDVLNGAGAERGGESISSTPEPATEVYTNCDGTDSVTTATIECFSNRVGPMYIAYFDSAVEANVTVNSTTQFAPLRMGEITYLEF